MQETADRDARPSPDALLEAARRAEAGRLKLFLGAAPGVGKTYEMLTGAHARKREGVDVVVGVVETHGRRETEALLEGLEVIPRRSIDYKGHTLQEMDLDAILARRPALVLVDELAHTNAPGSRHAKRYLDVQELLAAGIDVYTTLNIQHVESLTDVVARITRIRMRELVPDAIIDRADEVEVIDLTPEDLIQRLREGKVYVPQQAQRAIRHYFSPGNLTALRELALRRTAQRVDAQMLSYMQSHAIRGPWPAGERVLVCIDEGPGSAALVRHAGRFAEQLHAPWTALHVETARAGRRSEAAQDRIAEALRLAERLGGAALTIPGQDIVDTVVDYARENNVTHVIIARARRGGWRGWLRGPVERRLLRRAGDLTIHLLPPPVETPRGPERAAPAGATIDPGAHAGSAAIVLAGLLVALAMHRVLPASDVSLVFLTAVLASAIAYGLWPSLLACLLSVLAYNFFFLPPLYTFTIADPENVVALFFFAIVAVLASNLAARVRAQAIVARSRAKTTEELYQFSRKLAVAVALDDLLWATAHQIALMLKVRVVLLLPEDGTLAVRAGYPPEDLLDAADIAAATWCWQHNQPGRARRRHPAGRANGCSCRCAPAAARSAWSGIDRDAPARLLTPEQRRLLDALADQAALAIERVALAEDLDRARLAAETDRLRAALLTSISHDLRTPLASILGSASSLVADARPARTGRAPGADPHHPGGGGAAQPLHRQPARHDAAGSGAGDAGDRARRPVGRGRRRRCARAEKLLAGHRVEVDLAPDLPMLALDVVLFEQVLFNLLDNAAKYAPAGSRIGLRAWRDGGLGADRSSLDEGDGIAAADLAHLFDKFYRVPRTDRRPRRHRPRPRDLPRLRRGDGRADRGGQPHRPPRRRIHHRPAGAAGAPRRPGGRGGMSEGLRILIVDDDPAIRRFLRTGLTAQGYRPSEAETGRAALAALARGAVDLVVLDLGLPDIDGLEVIRDLRAAGNAVPIIVLSCATRRRRRSPPSISAPTTTSPSRSASTSCYARIRAAAAPSAAAAGRGAGIPLRRRSWSTWCAGSSPCRGRDGEAVAAGIRPAAAAGRACGQGADAPDDPARGLGRGDRRAVSAHLHPRPAPEDRGRTGPPAPHRDRNGGGLSVAPARPSRGGGGG